MRYTLGLDVSTQSVSAVVLDTERATISHRVSLAYREDARLNRFGIDHESLLVPPREEGEADQPPLMFLAGIDAIFADLVATGAPLTEIGAIAVSAQQHGHLYLDERAGTLIAALGEKGAGGTTLTAQLRDAFTYGTAPIWQSANTGTEAAEIRERLGGTEPTVRLSGSDSPMRFTGAVVRRIGRRYPEIYERTARISLLSNFLSAVLSARPDTPIDWGNGSGMSLMDYAKRKWSDRLLAAVADDLPGGTEALRDKLPKIASPSAIAGPIARYFVERYGLAPSCLVTIGSGDNPQSKVMTSGDLLSLGSSFVYMVDTPKPTVDLQGYANSMYDGIGRPFVFACRTNGAMVWDRLRAAFGADLAKADAALEATPPGSSVAIWQPYAESYPVSPPIPNGGAESGAGAFAELYPALVDFALASSRHYARGFDRGGGPLAVTGGPAHSTPILRRIAAIWRRPVYTIGDAGAAIGSAVGAWWAMQLHGGADPSVVQSELETLRRALLPRGEQVEPDPGAVESYHGKHGYIDRVIDEFENHLE